MLSVTNQQTINQLLRGNSNGFYYAKRVGGAVIKIGSPAPPNNGTFETFNGTALSTTDYKTDTINNFNGVFHSENYLDHAPSTSIIAPIPFDTAVRVVDVPAITDKADVTFTFVSGTFRYRLQS